MLIFCTGATGLVGYNFVKAASSVGHKVIAVCGKNKLPEMNSVKSISCDLSDIGQVQRAVLDVFPDVIVNCAAMSHPTDVDANPELAEKLNIALPEALAFLADHVGARLIHLSTDMVFDGTAAPYKNTDVPMPLNLYGQTKLLAEKKVLKAAAPSSVVLRISHVSGNSLTTHRSLHEKLLRQWAKGIKTPQSNNDIKRPLSVERLSSLLCEICERQKLSGIYHFAGLESLSRYDMACSIAKYFGLDPDKYIEKVSSETPCDLSLDMSCLAARVKTQSCMFAELLREMALPQDLYDWLKSAGGKAPIKRYVL